ncbi:alpha/beta hydrolase-fold protein [uncultured Microbacterium sp.]|uniref:alpha/beta hydrolase n=1 Tax=uncultured Microbacterium sp. TaxID=191216 RepID=UPI0025CE5439|nr:alpha/beta hydrolase-fold protein [uncultured Microbacterium sp.]
MDASHAIDPAELPLVPPLDAAAVLWSAPEAERSGRDVIVLLHGYGADERDLWPLRGYLPAEPVVASVRAPLTPPWPAPGASWYPIEGLQNRDPRALTAAAVRFIQWVEATFDPTARVGLLGFSQGASISLQAMRLQPERFAYAVALSGFVAPGALASDAALAASRPPVFWGRGSLDDVIPEALIVHSTDWLPGHVELSGRVYAGLGHSISEPELTDIRTFIDKQLAEDPS